MIYFVLEGLGWTILKHLIRRQQFYCFPQTNDFEYVVDKIKNGSRGRLLHTLSNLPLTKKLPKESSKKKKHK